MPVGDMQSLIMFRYLRADVLGWKARTQAELKLMDDLSPLLHKLALGSEIAGLAAYEEERIA